MEQRDFFISYNKRDEHWALHVAEILRVHGYRAYVQKLDIKPGENFVMKMNEFLKSSGSFIAIWSKNYSESPYCMAELSAAFNEYTNKRHQFPSFMRP